MGSALMVTAKFMFSDRGTFWVLPLAYVYLPKSARSYLFPNLSKLITFAAAPLVLTISIIIIMFIITINITNNITFTIVITIVITINITISIVIIVSVDPICPQANI